MRCEKLKLALYSDSILSEKENKLIEEHLLICPVCRYRLAEIRALRQNLKSLSKTIPSNELIDSVRNAVAVEIEKMQRAKEENRDLQRWLQFRFMPYFIGVTVSLLLFSSLWISLFSISKEGPVQIPQWSSPISVNNFAGEKFDNAIVEYVAARRSVAAESPSLNPSGALANISKSLADQSIGRKGVVVIAEVFSNGMARISEVVEPPRDKELLKRIREALEYYPNDAAFLPATLDNRPNTMKVVLKIQEVQVSDKSSNSSKTSSEKTNSNF